MRCALLDTNFLMIPGRFKVDIFAELDRLGYRPIVLSCVVGEVKKLAKGKGRAAGQARIGMKLLASKKSEIVVVEGQADEMMLGYAVESGCAIATNDIALIRRAKKFGISVMRLRQKKYVVEE